MAGAPHCRPVDGAQLSAPAFQMKFQDGFQALDVSPSHQKIWYNTGPTQSGTLLVHYAPLTGYPGGAGNVSSHGVNVMPTIGGYFIYFMSGVLILLAVVWFICIIFGDADIRECFSNLSFDLGSGGYY